MFQKWNWTQIVSFDFVACSRRFGSVGMIPQFLVQLKLTFFRTQSAQNNLQFSQTFAEYIVLRTINTISIIGGFEGFGFRLIFYLVIFGLCSVKDVILLYHGVTISFRICLFGAIRNPWFELGKIFYPR